MLALAVSSYIEAIDPEMLDPRSRSDAAFALEELVDAPRFQPAFIVVRSTGEDFPSLTEQGDISSHQALRRLRQMKSWAANWNGEGADRPDPISIDKAIELLALMTPKQIGIGVGLDADSRPMFSIRDSSYDGHILIESGGAVSFFLKRDDDILADYEIPFDGRTLPEPLDEALSRI